MSDNDRKLLIVEDDPGLLNQLKWCFEGYEVFTAEDRESARDWQHSARRSSSRRTRK